MKRTSYYIVNAITLYRILAAPLLLYLLVSNRLDAFAKFLVLSFFTDLIDGFLARKFKVTSLFGTRMDSIGDDLTVLMAVIGMIMYKSEFVLEHKMAFIILFVLFLIQISYSLIKYQKFTSFHTYLAKTGALLQGLFLIHIFIMPAPDLFLFYSAVVITGLDLIEEIVMVYMLPRWTANVKGIFWLPEYVHLINKKNKSYENR
ncbi:MAG: CDP-alcohol phosphatidyltransferase family protein [Bacteroidota bacterium]